MAKITVEDFLDLVSVPSLPLSIVNGGTGQTSAANAITALLPAQSGNSGKFLGTNGTAASWNTVDSLPSQSGNSGKYLTTNGSAASWGSVLSMPAGCVLPFAGLTVPNGYLLCWGQEVSRTVFAALFATIGEYYGVGDSSTTFNLPDMRGRVPGGVDAMGGSVASRITNAVSGFTPDLGWSGGSQSHTLTIGEMPSHTHDVAVNTGLAGSTFSLAQSGVAGLPNNTSANQTRAQATGGGGAHRNVQPTLILNYIISTGATNSFVFQDSFADTDATSLTSHTPEVGGAWTLLQAGPDIPVIYDDEARQPNVSTECAAWADTGESDIDLMTSIRSGTTGNREWSILFRGSDQGNYWYVTQDNSTIYLHKRVGGTPTLVTYASVATNIATTYTYRIIATGTSIRVYRDGTLRLSTTSSDLQSHTKCGIRIGDDNSQPVTVSYFEVIGA